MTHPVSLGLREYQKLSDIAIKEDENHKPESQSPIIPKFHNVDELVDWICEGEIRKVEIAKWECKH